ncbi:MAG TPA: hypothetical protein VEU96_29695 [Bryobacteraceae bacterium]|nr:hypothetical protein [Bryobacteraceae bacterium]
MWLRTSILGLVALLSLFAQAPKGTPSPSRQSTSKTSPPDAAGKKTPVAAADVENGGPADKPAMLKITIEASRSPVMLGTPAGLSAEIKNVSPKALKLKENETVFVVMPEIRSGSMLQGCATFPTEGNGSPPKRPSDGYELVLQPGDSYRVYWDMNTDGCARAAALQTSLHVGPVLFSPGNYKAYLNIRFSPVESNITPETHYRTTSEGKDILVAASFWAILIGSFIGGILAYIIKSYSGVETTLTPKRALGRFTGKGAFVAELILAGLYACVLVILASRLSDTFPIKVNANDVLGAIALGFVFQWAGVKLLEKLPGMSPQGEAKNKPVAGAAPSNAAVGGGAVAGA